MVKILGVIVVLLLVVQGLSVLVFKRMASQLMDQVGAQVRPVQGNVVPEVILQFALRSGVNRRHLGRSIWLEQVAEMRLARGGDWQALSAQQVISTGAAGFVWLADQRIGPLLKFRVVDAYVAGEGRLNVRLLGSIPVAGSSGPQTDKAEAMRYLAELVWAPDAMLGNPDLQWVEQADGSVRVGLDLGGARAEVTFVFDGAGDIIEVRAAGRPTDTGPLDWRIYVSDYRDFDGVRVPARGEVGYVYDDGYEAYWRGEVTAYTLEY